MMRGIVNARLEAILPLKIRGPAGVEASIEVIVDTGYTASLTIPAYLVNVLGLVRVSGTSAILADGSVRQFDVYAAEIAWDDDWRPVAISVIGNESLLGMRLLAGHALAIDVVPGGQVAILQLT